MDWIRKPILQIDSVPSLPNGSESKAKSDADVEDEGGITADHVLEYLKNGKAWIVDARDPGEYADGHLKGALNIPSNEVYDREGQFMSIMPPDASIIVYCGGGGCESSHIVADALRRDFNFEHVYVYLNGWEEVESQHDRFADYIEFGGGM